MKKDGHEIKTIYGSRRTIKRTIVALVIARKPVFDVEIKRQGLMHIATITTDKAITIERA